MTTIHWAILISAIFIVFLVVKLVWFVRWINKKAEGGAEEKVVVKNLRDKQ